MVAKVSDLADMIIWKCLKYLKCAEVPKVKTEDNIHSRLWLST
jgi:hypothetical protein